MEDWLARMNSDEIYGNPHREVLPHVVKFSGGRSSGMLLKIFLDRGWLKAERGDVIIFNNTSAEHPATYEFTRQCASYAEQEFGVPFFWIEFATYEDVYGGDWTRSPTFRLVNRDPHSKSNPDGYHWRGETFEELVSYQGFLPSRTTRTCTAHLKLEITSRFLAEWFAGKKETLHRGHFYGSAQVTDKSLIDRHVASRGNLSSKELLSRRRFMRNQPFARETQRFTEFTDAPLRHEENDDLVRKSLGDYTTITGTNAIQFLSLIGLRNDERSRVYRVMARNHEAPESKGRRGTYVLEGETILTPLNTLQVTKTDVCEYWSQQSWNLTIPDEVNLSNCVFCFNKGSAELARISDRIAQLDQQLPTNLRSVQGTPSDINWWVELEDKYRRTAANRKSDDPNETVQIGMWGVNSRTSYVSIRDTKPSDLIATEPASAIPCDCTD